MTPVRETLLAALRCAAEGRALEPDPALSGQQWAELLCLAREQEILPLVYEAVYRCRSLSALDRDARLAYRDQAVQLAARQVVQENEFLTLLLHAQARGLRPTVLKGAVVRDLYPRPMLRPSVDEDLLIPPGEAPAYHEFLLREGLFSDDPQSDAASDPELSYHRENSPTYIELHMSPFPPSEAYGDCNAPFAGALDRTVEVPIQDVTVRTLAPTDHLLFLICHAYKHFLHSGVGIRQICDMGLFVRRYRGELDEERILSVCRELRIDQLAAALFAIGQRYLGLDGPAVFDGYDVDLDPLLEDVLSDGIYGMSDLDRAHASTLTLDAVAAQRTGRRRGGALRSVFLPASALAGRYAYLRKRPWLLPAAWGQRIWDYVFRQKHVSPGQSVRIGNRRIALFRRYGVID